MDISQNSCNLDKGKMTRRGIKTQKYFFFLPSLPSPPSPPFQMAPQIYFLEDISWQSSPNASEKYQVSYANSCLQFLPYVQFHSSIFPQFGVI